METMSHPAILDAHSGIIVFFRVLGLLICQFGKFSQGNGCGPLPSARLIIFTCHERAGLCGTTQYFTTLRVFFHFHLLWSRTLDPRPLITSRRSVGPTVPHRSERLAESPYPEKTQIAPLHHHTVAKRSGDSWMASVRSASTLLLLIHMNYL